MRSISMKKQNKKHEMEPQPFENLEGFVDPWNLETLKPTAKKPRHQQAKKPRNLKPINRYTKKPINQQLNKPRTLDTKKPRNQ